VYFQLIGVACIFDIVIGINELSQKLCVSALTAILIAERLFSRDVV